jgi:hypothetical protein
MDKLQQNILNALSEPVFVTHSNMQSWLDVVWDALHSHRETCIPEGDPAYDAEWDEICTAMAWITEELGVDLDD